MNFILLGRPNVGKSSIYNLLTGVNKSIIHRSTGTTRDWHKAQSYFSLSSFIFDTPGIIFNSTKNDAIKYKEVVEGIIKKTDVILFVIDYKSIFNSQLKSVK